MELIDNMVGFTPDTHEPRRKFIVPLHYALFDHIYQRWVESIHHVFVLCLLHIPHMKEYTILLYFPVVIPKGGNDFIKTMVIYVFVKRNGAWLSITGGVTDLQYTRWLLHW